jgi:hypothetical protein
VEKCVVVAKFCIHIWTKRMQGDGVGKAELSFPKTKSVEAAATGRGRTYIKYIDEWNSIA